LASLCHVPFSIWLVLVLVLARVRMYYARGRLECQYVLWLFFCGAFSAVSANIARCLLRVSSTIVQYGHRDLVIEVMAAGAVRKAHSRLGLAEALAERWRSAVHLRGHLIRAADAPTSRPFPRALIREAREAAQAHQILPRVRGVKTRQELFLGPSPALRPVHRNSHSSGHLNRS